MVVKQGHPMLAHLVLLDLYFDKVVKHMEANIAVADEPINIEWLATSDAKPNHTNCPQ